MLAWTELALTEVGVIDGAKKQTYQEVVVSSASHYGCGGRGVVKRREG